MQTVGAQWLMGSLGGSALEVALVQAAITLPVFLVALPAGALGDILDRRKLLLVSQSMMLAAAALLAVVTFSGGASPWLLLALTFLLGTGQGLTLPSWQAIVPELVEPGEIPLAAALAGVNMNVSRAVGPALGGALVAAAGAEWTFALNALSFLGVVAVIARWQRLTPLRPLGPERIGPAMRSGLSYAAHAPKLRAVFVRAAVFVAFAGSLWALLPVLVRADMGLGASGYGLLLGAVGFGAVAGAGAFARLQRARSTDWLVVAASLGFGLACAVCALAPSVPAVTAALVLAGAAWITATSSLNGTAITLLPSWVSSRGLALYTLVFQGGQAVSAIAWGLVAQFAGTRTALGGVAAGLILAPAVVWRWRLPSAGDLDVTPTPWPVTPELAGEPDPRVGPVLVIVEYHVPADRHADFRERMAGVGRARRRTGAKRWELYQDGADPDWFVEEFLVGTWEEHLRQHGERGTAHDRADLADAAALADGPPRVRHLLYAYSDPARTGGGGFLWDRPSG
jgi:MFS family permease